MRPKKSPVCFKSTCNNVQIAGNAQRDIKEIQALKGNKHVQQTAKTTDSRCARSLFSSLAFSRPLVFDCQVLHFQRPLLRPTRVNSQTHIDRFWGFGTAHSCDQQAETETNKPCYVLVMRDKRNPKYQR